MGCGDVCGLCVSLCGLCVEGLCLVWFVIVCVWCVFGSGMVCYCSLFDLIISHLHTQEEELPPVPFRRQNLERLKEKRRDVEEDKLRQKDREKQRRRREMDMPGLVMQINKMNDPDAVRKFMKMVCASLFCCTVWCM